MEAQHVRNDERRHAQHRVAEDVEGDEQPVVPVHHARHRAVGLADDGFAFRCANRARPNRSACAPDRDADRTGDRWRGESPSANAAGAGFVDEDAGFAGDDGFERAAAGVGDDRPAARLRLERHDAEVLLARQQHDGGAAIQIANLVVAAAAEKRHVLIAGRCVAGMPLERCRDPVHRRRSSAARRRVGRRQWRDRAVCRARALTRPARDRPGTACIGMEKVSVDRRIHHSRLAIIVSADPARNIMRNSDIAVRAGRRLAVPPRQPVHHQPHQRGWPAGPSRSGPK